MHFTTINELYSNLTFALASALMTLCVLFFALSNSVESLTLKRALRMMAFTYCIFGLVNLFELWSRIAIPEADDVLLFRVTTLIVAVSQAFLFTFTLILLIDAAYLTHKRVMRELIPVVILSIAFVVAFFILPNAYLSVTVHLFTLFYLCLLIRYLRLFIVHYRHCLQKINNFFSGQEAQQLRWVKVSFYAVLSIGVLALVTSLFPSVYIGVGSSVVYLLFYLYFAIRFVHYCFVYTKMEVALSNDNSIQHKQHDNDRSEQEGDNMNILEVKLNKWIEEKRFLQSGITIEDVSFEIGTNRSYLSEHINSIKGISFRQWINELRISEAKILLQQYPKMSVSDVAIKVGFANKSHFGRTFLALHNATPQNWRKSQGQ